MKNILKIIKNNKYLFSKNKQIQKNIQQKLIVPQTIQQIIQKQSKPQIIFQALQSQLMQKPQNTIIIPGNKHRQFTQIQQLQRDILINKKFDLMNTKIIPKTININQTQLMEGFTQIDLGTIGAKQKNEILLSQVNPQAIPEDLDILFKGKKKLMLVGKLMELTKGKKKQESISTSNEMKVEQKTIQQFSIQQLRKKQFGIRAQYISFNKNEFFRSIIFLFPVVFIFLDPIIETFLELKQCDLSIQQIQQQQFKFLNQLKKQYQIRTLLENPDFNEKAL